MSAITINGVTLELDLLDADVMEKYEKLNLEIANDVAEPTQYEGLSNAEGMRLQCRYIDRFFDKLFGAGTAQQLFGGGNNLGVRLEAFGIVSEASAQIDKRIHVLHSKYGTERLQNREQRRRKGRKQRYRNDANRGAAR